MIVSQALRAAEATFFGSVFVTIFAALFTFCALDGDFVRPETLVPERSA